VLAEGAGIFVLEELHSALCRGASVYGEIIGYGKSGEAAAELPGYGLQRAMEHALSDADVGPADVGCISAHGPSDVIIDRCESDAIKKVLGKYAYRIPVTSIKGHTGNPLSAAGPLQLAAMLLGMKERMIPPTINYEFPDPECDLDYVPNVPRHAEIRIALVNSHGLGKTNSVLVIRKYPQ
jgi:3-oxoacyl-(acyl-carrier-protein) synthase